jgi:hypothetical protein
MEKSEIVMPESGSRNMTKEQALQALREGKKVTHRLFAYNEWMKLVAGDTIVFEDGVHLSISDFFHHRNEKEWSDGYYLFATKHT